MKVLQIANGYMSRNLYRELFGNLSAIGVENQIFVPGNYKTPEQRNGNVFVCPCFNSLDRVLFFTKQGKMLEKIKSTYETKDFDVVHAHTVFSGGYSAMKLHQKYGLPYLIAVRNTDVNTFFKYMPHLRPVGVKIMREASRIVFLSPAYKKNMIANYIPQKWQQEIIDKSLVIPNGINHCFFEHRGDSKIINKKVIHLIQIGILCTNKNLETTVHATELLRKQGMNVDLTVVGKTLEGKYQKLLDERPFIKYFPACSQVEVIQHLREADIFVLPSHAETFGLTYAEAMSQGLPVLYTRGQGFDGQFQEGQVGFHVDDHSVEDIADKVRLVLEDYTGISKRCIEGALRFDWKTIALRYRNLYTEIVQENREP